MEGTGDNRSEAPGARQDSVASRVRTTVTRREFLVGAGVGAGTAAVLLGGATVATQVLATKPPAVTTTGPVPLTMRRVALDIDGATHDVIVDNRESLWETMNFQLGLSNSNLGCDRAQCGACAVTVDGRAVNSCTVLSARLGKGQKIGTVAGLATGPGVAGLHPVQRAFWLDGGFQCGICTRGFIMATIPLIKQFPNPTNPQIAEALSGNICRCGEYPKIFTAVKTAAKEMRGEKVTYLASPVLVEATGVTTTATVTGTSKDFSFATPLGTIEDLDPLENDLKKRDGILAVSGSERAITVRWDPAKLDEAKVRDLLKTLGRPVR